MTAPNVSLWIAGSLGVGVAAVTLALAWLRLRRTGRALSESEERFRRLSA